MGRRWTTCFAAVLACGVSAPSRAEMVTRRWGRASSRPPGKAAPKAPATPPTCYVPRCKTPPRLDGSPREKAWRAAPACRLSRTLNGAGGAAVATEVRLLRDRKRLYVAVRCAEPLLSKLRATGGGHDGEIWLDDSIELFLGPVGKAYYHVGVSAAGSTYDAKVKDRSWDSGVRAAVGRGAGAWTIEIAIPLAAMAAGKAPEAWTANFTRNRYAAGSWQEFAWSPTYSGDSHVPARFGRMLFRDPPAGRPAAAPPRPVVTKRLVTVLPASGGEGVVRFDLSALPAGAGIYRADLRIHRTAKVTGRMPEALEGVDVRPLLASFQAGSEPEAPGRPLALRAPFGDRLDATDAVRQWAAGKPNGGFFVKTCPFWHAEATCLDVACEGKPDDVPTPVRGVRALHRAGQTFLTWEEVDPLITTAKTTYGEIKRKLASPAATRACRYRIYAHAEPITAANLHAARLLGEAGPLSAYNVNARNKEYLIAQAMVQPDELGELARDYNGYMHTWTMDHPRMDRYPVRRFVIDEEAGELPVGAGLYVHHPARAGRRCYAVVSTRGGVENTRDFSPANAPRGAVKEAVGTGKPVRQGKGLHGPYFDWPGTRWVYVQWAAPPLAPRPNMAFNYSVLLPPNVRGKAPCELYFHGEGYSYAQPGKKMMLHSIQLAPHDWPPSGWYGYHDAWGTLGSFRRGIVRDHTQRRILAFLAWAQRALPIDPDRVYAVGADGAAAIALAHPEAFACVYVTGFDRRGVLDPKAAGSFADAWGPSSPNIADAHGRGHWGWAMLDERVLARPAARLPLFVCRGASWGRDKGWGKGRGRLYRALHKARQPLVAHWAWGGKLPRPDKHTGLWRGLDVRRDTPIPAVSGCSLDKEGEGGGNTNATVSWRDAKDTAEAFEVTVLCRTCTFDLTPRRLRRFRIRPREKLAWTARPLPGRRGETPAARRGRVDADADGVATIPGLEVPKDTPGLTVRITRAP